MDDIDQKKINAIRSILDVNFIASRNRYGNETEKEILSALKQFEPEPLEVEIESYSGGYSLWFEFLRPNWFRTKEQAIEFAEKKGLKVRG